MVKVLIGRGKTTVDVYKNNYERIKLHAAAERYNIKEYINELLKLTLNKYDFAKKFAPHLEIDSVDGKKITLKDKKNKALVDLHFVNNELRCEVDKDSRCCIHARYVWLMPHFAKLSGVGAIETDEVKDSTALTSSLIL
jgi:hypothetical protein